MYLQGPLGPILGGNLNPLIFKFFFRHMKPRGQGGGKPLTLNPRTSSPLPNFCQGRTPCLSVCGVRGLAGCPSIEDFGPESWALSRMQRFDFRFHVCRSSLSCATGTTRVMSSTAQVERETERSAAVALIHTQPRNPHFRSEARNTNGGFQKLGIFLGFP